MSEKAFCNGRWNDGAPICEVHGERLVNRATAEAKLGKLEQPDFSGAFYCPVSGSMISFNAASHDATRHSGIELP
jgi:hypothetical protein